MLNPSHFVKKVRRLEPGILHVLDVAGGSLMEDVPIWPGFGTPLVLVETYRDGLFPDNAHFLAAMQL